MLSKYAEDDGLYMRGGNPIRVSNYASIHNI
jgi:hypothetical protein